MPRKKKNVKAAKVRLNLRIRNLNTGQLQENHEDIWIFIEKELLEK